MSRLWSVVRPRSLPARDQENGRGAWRAAVPGTQNAFHVVSLLKPHSYGSGAGIARRGGAYFFYPPAVLCSTGAEYHSKNPRDAATAQGPAEEGCLKARKERAGLWSFVYHAIPPHAAFLFHCLGTSPRPISVTTESATLSRETGSTSLIPRNRIPRPPRPRSSRCW